MLNYQRVYPINIPLNHHKIPLKHHKIPLKSFFLDKHHQRCKKNVRRLLGHCSNWEPLVVRASQLVVRCWKVQALETGSIMGNIWKYQEPKWIKLKDLKSKIITIHLSKDMSCRSSQPHSPSCSRDRSTGERGEQNQPRRHASGMAAGYLHFATILTKNVS